MGVFDNFPYTNVHDLNTDWLVKTVKEVKDKTDVIDQAVTDAQDAADNAKTSEDNAKISEDNAKTSEDNAAEYYDNIETYTASLKNQVETNTTDIAVNSGRIDNIISGVTPDANVELLDIRIGADGTTYPTAGDAVRDQIDNVTDMIDDIVTHTPNLFDKYRVLNKTALNNSGDYNNTFLSSNYATSAIIPVDSSKQYCCNSLTFGTNCRINCYKGDGSYLGGIYGVLDNDGVTYVFTFSGGYLQTKFIRFHYQYTKLNSDTFMLCEGTTLPLTYQPYGIEFHYPIVENTKPTYYDGKDIEIFNKGICIGDSITAGTFNYTDNGNTAYITIPKYSYPTKLHKMTGLDIINAGDAGETAISWWTAHQNDDLSGHDFAIILLGINDALQYNGWTTATENAFLSIIQKLQNENNNIFVFVSSIQPAQAYQQASISTVNSGIETMVSNLNDDHVIFIDLRKYGNTYNLSEADCMCYNAGHMTAYGYERIAEDLRNYISWYIHNNKMLFRFVQFIGTNYQY